MQPKLVTFNDKKALTYTYHKIQECNMCGAPASSFITLGRRMNCPQGLRPSKHAGILSTVQQCLCCGLNFPNPLPLPASLDQHYGVPPESYWKASYFNLDPTYFKSQIDTFFRLSNVSNGEGKTALDIGAGIGKCMIALKNAGFDAFGFEPSEPFYNKAIETMKIDPEKIMLASIEDSHYASGAFHFISFGAVLEHLYDPYYAIQKAVGWLKPGGFIHIEIPSSRWFVGRILNFLYRVRGMDYVGNLSPMHSPYHIYEFGLKSFEECSKKLGCTVAWHQYMVARTYLPGVLSPIARWYMKKTHTGMQLEVWLTK